MKSTHEQGFEEINTLKQIQLRNKMFLSSLLFRQKTSLRPLITIFITNIIPMLFRINGR